MILALLAAALLVGGATVLYLAAPNQSLTRQKAGPPVAYAGVAALVGALVVLLSLMGPATAVFTWMTGIMLLWTVPPLAIGWLRHRREETR
ncbi:MAG: hypothetical protein EOP17_01090 [Rhizobiaceae bacterium]|nr:MAG: hypothetical protein EOP17_01090 [Rhizobiaceae bacterium]